MAALRELAESSGLEGCVVLAEIPAMDEPVEAIVRWQGMLRMKPGRGDPTAAQ